jgi:hypothetical protein
MEKPCPMLGSRLFRIVKDIQHLSACELLWGLQPFIGGQCNAGDSIMAEQLP